MMHRDVIMRQIQQAVQVLLQALALVHRLKSEERYEEAVSAIREAFSDLQLTPRPVRELTEDELVEMCTSERGFEVDLALSVADLLREEAGALSEMGQEDASRRTAGKALALYRRAVSVDGAALPIDMGRRMDAAESLLEGP